MSLKATFPGAIFGRPAKPEEIEKAEGTLGVRIPAALRELYIECDGFREPRGNAKYLLSLEDEDFIGSLVKTTLSQWADHEYWRPTGIDPTDFLFFGYSSADAVWGIRIDAPHEVIKYHHSQEDEVTRLSEDVFEVFRNDFQKYDD